MNINQLRYFASVYESQSFSQAAQKRDVTVQAVSKSISDLEREFPDSLFTRSNQGATPTQLGREFYQRVMPVLSAFGQLESFAHGEEMLTEEPAYRVGLCAPSFSDDNGLYKALASFIGSKAGLSIKLYPTNVQDAQVQLENGTLDAFITIGAYQNPNTKCLVLGTLPTGIAVAATHPLASKRQVNLNDLLAYPAGASPISDTLNNSILKEYKRKGLVSNIENVKTMPAEDVEFMTNRNGYFFGVMYPSVNQAREHIAFVPIDPAQAIRVPICSISLKENTDMGWRTDEEFLIRAIGHACGNEPLIA